MCESEILNAETSFRDASRRLVDKPMGEIGRCLAGARAGDDVEAIHDLRVATRRLRAVLSVIEPAYSGKALANFEKQIADLTDHLGAARDTDVFIEFLNDQINESAQAKAFERIGLEAFRDSLKQQRAEQQEVLVKALEHIDEDSLKSDARELFAGEEHL